MASATGNATEAPGHTWRRIGLPGADLRLDESFIEAEEAGQLMARLVEELAWRRDEVKIFGRRHPIPRLHHWAGDLGATYRWSGLRMCAQGWTPTLAEIRARVEARTGTRYQGVLANLYRDGADAMGWHADDEPELGPQPVIASVSLGATRDFVLRPRPGRAAEGAQRCVLPLVSGSLLVMRGGTQENWQHALPRRARVREPRVNLTFRPVSIASKR